MTFNMFGSDSAHGGAYAFDRGAMLVGAPAAMIIFDTGPDRGVLPSDLDGPTPPPDGAPNYFLTFEIDPAALRRMAIPRRLDDAGQQHVHRADRHSGCGLHLARLRRGTAANAFPSWDRRTGSKHSTTT